MDAKQAIESAKSYIIDLFGEDGLGAVRLEEIEKKDGLWNVTIGFSRPLASAEAGDRMAGALAQIKGVYGPRVYRVVTLDEQGDIRSVRIREGLD